jgi:hypothetical protein
VGARVEFLVFTNPSLPKQFKANHILKPELFCCRHPAAQIQHSLASLSFFGEVNGF